MKLLCVPIHLFMKRLSRYFSSCFCLVLLILLGSCEEDRNTTSFNPTPVEIEIPSNFPSLVIPDNNPMTEEGIALGRKLFHDPILSGDNSQSCASCHAQEFGFSDENRFSEGIDGTVGNRNAMTLINLGTLEEQALEPVTNPIEMHDTWPNVESKLMSHPEYPELFYAAFGNSIIDSTQVVKAIAQFERTLISSNSKWDKVLRGEAELNSQEEAGMILFFSERGDCFHCHGTALLTDNLFHNNGLDSEFSDLGLGRVTRDENDHGKFRTPTLRNIAFSGPYMHDGRFSTLREVIDFYSEGVQWSPTIDPLMKRVDNGGIQLGELEKQDLIAFLHTLSDTTFITNTEFDNPL